MEVIFDGSARMSLERLSEFLLWCIGLNAVLLVLWFAAWVFGGERIHRLHTRWFRLDRAAYDAAVFQLLGLYKVGLWLFFIIPWIAVQAIRS